MPRLFKSPDVRAYRLRREPGLLLTRAGSRSTSRLDFEHAQAWETWPTSIEGQEWLAPLAEHGLVCEAAGSVLPLPAIDADDAVFSPSSHNVKWYEESPDLTVLFHSDCMPGNNPLLALSPYGSQVWKGVTAGRTVRMMREEAMRVFGVDEVEPFLYRLKDLGLIVSDSPAVLHPWHEERVTKEFLAPEIQFEVVQSRIPWYCLWELGTVCNLRCEICYQEDFTHRGPTEDEAIGIAKSMVESGLFYVALLGGEPLVRKDLLPIVRTLREGGVFTKIITNGTLLTPKLARDLSEAGLNLIEVSFDGVRAESHDASRGEGTFDKAVEGVRNAKEAGVPRLGVVCTLHSGNLPDFDRLPEFLDGLGVQECYLSLFKKTGLNGSHAPWSPPTIEDQDRIRRLIVQWRASHPHLTVVLLPGCSCGRTSAVIGADSTLRLCSFHYASKGNILQSSLLDVWQGLEKDLPESGPLGFCKVVKPCSS